MILVLASGNKGKLREFQEAFGSELRSVEELMEAFEIEETEQSFAGNALLKARAIYEKLGAGHLVISDDSGISVPLLGGAPGIYSARYAGEGAEDRDNLFKLMGELKAQGVSRTPAYYTAAVALVSQQGEYVVHGWMHGDVIDELRGTGGFGYDPIFIPQGYEKTLGELEPSIKSTISHRSKAIERARPLIQILKRKA